MTDSSGINAHRFLPTLASCLSRPLRSDGPILILGPTGQMKLIYSADPLAGGSNNKLPDCRPVIHLLLRFILWPTNRFINGVHSIKSPRWDSFRFEKPAPSYRFLSSVHLSVFFPLFFLASVSADWPFNRIATPTSAHTRMAGKVVRK